jgi:histidyl-tRNA synthetase
MRDWPPETATKLNAVLDTVRSVFERYGFLPLETPAVENFELLSAKGGLGEAVRDEIYYFKDKAGRELGLRFDLTMSLARFVIANPNLPKPFKRWQIGRAWRYDEPQAFRYREFIQADIDIIGTSSALADAECLAAAADCMAALGFKDFFIRLANRKLSEAVLVRLGVPQRRVLEVFRSIDKLNKLGEAAVRDELATKGVAAKIIDDVFAFIKIAGSNAAVLDEIERKYGQLPGLDELRALLAALGQLGAARWARLDMSLVRGLDYYTGNVFELMIGKEKITFAAGGRFDNLIEQLAGPPMPAVGISLGIDRIVAEADRRGLLKPRPPAAVFVAAAVDAVRPDALRIAQRLRARGIAVESDLLRRKLSRQLEYAAALRIPRVAIVGPIELKKKSIKLRDMRTGKEQIVKISALDKVIG